MILDAKQLHRQVDDCMQAEQHRLRRRIRAVAGKSTTDDDGARALLDAITRSKAERERRVAACPAPRYPDDLPVVQCRETIMAAIAANQVVIVCGETGSGKTTQLPKMCLELGRGCGGLIGHTQPRRIAARSVAARIATELDSRVGEAVGFKIRFTDTISEHSYIKLMTDGILLSEIQTDPYLNRYDTLIIDEAHERSLNIDFLLGYLKRLLPRRRDLKLIITSATIDPERFSRHFDDAPVILAEGRTYPVELRYLPPEELLGGSGKGGDGQRGGGQGGNPAGGDGDGDDTDDAAVRLAEEADSPAAIVAACETLLAERRHDVLVFLTGERDIREMADVLRKAAPGSKALRGAEVVPLYSRLSNAEQNRIFEKHSAPRIILATNVAETSLTVPGIRSVVDTGLARMSRYSVRSKVQRLPIERVSQASANQRMGRCGREAPGVCIRLYSEEDFLSRREFTEPEILRTNLSSVILQMATMQLGDIDDFPFVEAPESKFVNDGYRSLQELGALDERRRLTPLGRRLARLPLDPRLARMLLAAVDEGCVGDVLTIVSALSIQDPRDRPFDKREAADQMHAEFHDERSDFLAWLNLWQFVTVQKENLSNSRFRAMCRQRFLSPLRIIEWMDVRQQLIRLCKDLSITIGTAEAAPEAIHRALLTGLLSNVATKTDKHDYLGTRNRHLAIFPGSALFKKGPKWIMAAEIAETSRLYARQVAGIQPEWIERIGEHLLQRSYRDAHWQGKQGRVGAFEQSTLYGLVINPKKRIDYSRINPAESRQIFIRDGLVNGGMRSSAPFYVHNLALLEEVTTLEEKSRRRDIVVDPESLVRFYDAIVPDDVCTVADFERFRKRYEEDHPRGLYFDREMLLADDADVVSSHDFPDQLDIGGMVLPLRYHFSPGDEADGVTLVCPVEVLNRVPARRCEWLVPGMLEEKIALMIKSLPKNLRRNFVPAPDYAKAAVEAMTPSDAPLASALSRHLQRMSGVEVRRDDWDLSALPVHLAMRIEVIDVNGKVLDSGRDIEALQTRFADRVEESLLRFSDSSIERDAVTDWNFGDLPDSVDIDKGGITLQGYPALQVTDTGVGIKLFASPAAAAEAMPPGVRALYRQVLREEIKYLQRKLPGIDVLSLRFAPFGSKQALIDDIIDAAVDDCFIDTGHLPRTRDAFMASLEAHRGDLVARAGEFCDVLLQVFEAHRDVARRIEGAVSLSWVEAIADIREQIAALLYPGFVSDTGLERLRRVAVYFRAMLRRLEAIDQAPDKDRRRRAEFLPVWQAFRDLPHRRDDDAGYATAWRALRWAFEELRVSLFAQELGTEGKVSVSRLENRVQELRKRP